MSLLQKKYLEAISIKNPDYSLGVYIKFGKNLKPLKTDTARKPISKVVEWCQFELHSLFLCRDNCVQVSTGMYSNKRVLE